MRRGDKTVFQGNWKAMKRSQSGSGLGKVIIQELGPFYCFWIQDFRQAVCLEELEVHEKRKGVSPHTSCCATAEALQKAFVTSRDVHVLLLILDRMASAGDSRISSSAAVKCPEVLGTVVKSRGKFESELSGNKYSSGIASFRRFWAMAAISL